MGITAIVLIEAEPDAIADLGPRLTEIDGVAEAHSVAGGDTDLVVIVKVTDHESIARVITEHIAKLPRHQVDQHDDCVPFVFGRSDGRGLRRLRGLTRC